MPWSLTVLAPIWEIESIVWQRYNNRRTLEYLEPNTTAPLVSEKHLRAVY